MKKNDGMSLIALVVTIVVMLILAGVSIFYGTRENITTAYETDMYTEIMNVCEAVQQRYLLNRANPALHPYVGIKLTDDTKIKIGSGEYGDGWYHLKPNHLIELNLENVTNEYVASYPTGEVVAVKPIIYNDKEYFSSSEIKQVMGEEKTEVSDNMFNEVKGVNKPQLISGMIPVRNVNGKWIVTNEDDPKWYDYSAENKIWANVMFLDEITITGYTNETIRTTSLSELEGREIETIGSMFIWLPRHSSNGSNVVYSRLLQDYKENGYSVPLSFVKNGRQEVGLWISKYDSDYIN